jgi:ankyrin repeat protein
MRLRSTSHCAPEHSLIISAHFTLLTRRRPHRPYPALFSQSQTLLEDKAMASVSPLRAAQGTPVRRRATPDDVLQAVRRGDLDNLTRMLRRNHRLVGAIHGPDGCTPPLLACKQGACILDGLNKLLFPPPCARTRIHLPPPKRRTLLSSPHPCAPFFLAIGSHPPAIALHHLARLCASPTGHLEIAKYFFRNGATINDRDRDPKVGITSTEHPPPPHPLPCPHSIDKHTANIGRAHTTFLPAPPCLVNSLLPNCHPNPHSAHACTRFNLQRQGNALHYAAWGGHLDVVRWLVDVEGASLDDVDVVGNTALLYAVYGGHRHVVDELLARGRSLQERNSKNHTALLQAACGGHLDLVQWLLEQGFSLDEADLDGNTALLFAAWGGHLDLIHFLLENGSSLKEKNNNGHSIFLSAANGGRVPIVKWLLEKGFSLSETNNNGDTALLLAAYGGHQMLVEELLAMGASLTDKNACGFTPLLSAANGGQLEMAR